MRDGDVIPGAVLRHASIGRTAVNQARAAGTLPDVAMITRYVSPEYYEPLTKYYEPLDELLKLSRANATCHGPRQTLATIFAIQSNSQWLDQVKLEWANPGSRTGGTHAKHSHNDQRNHRSS